MALEEDLKFGQRAIALGFINSAQLSECLKLQQEWKTQKISLSIVEVLEKQNYLTPAKIAIVKHHCNDSEVQGTEPLEVITPEAKQKLLFPKTLSPLNSQNESMETRGRKETSSAVSPSSAQVPITTKRQADCYLQTPTKKLAEEKSQNISDVLLGRYKIIEEIGRGGMGKVYKAYDPQLDRVVALKMLLHQSSEEDVERFLREAKASAKLRHPNIIGVYDIGCENGQQFFTMDFIDGPSLHAVLKESKLTVRQILDIMAKIGNAIHYAHGQGIIHRDLKPANVMMDKGQEPKVMDFGLAKMARDTKKISKTGALLGTLQYMSPEQAQGKLRAVDEQSDVYSMGAMLYEMLTGHPPFTGNSLPHIIEQIIHREATPPSRIRKSIPVTLDTICMRALAKKKEDRYPNAAAFVEDIERIFLKKGRESRSTVSYREILQKNHILYFLASLVIIAVVSVILVCIHKSASNKTRSVGQLEPRKHKDSKSTETQKHREYEKSQKISILSPVELQSMQTMEVPAMTERLQLTGEIHGDSSVTSVRIGTSEAKWDPSSKKFMGEIDLLPGRNQVKISVLDSKAKWHSRIWEIIRAQPEKRPTEIVNPVSNQSTEVSAINTECVFKFKTGGSIYTDPLVHENCVYFGSVDNYFYAVDISTHQLKWKFATKGKIYSSPALADGIVYFGSTDRYLYALHLKDGKLLWEFLTQGCVTLPIIKDGIVYVGVGNNDGCLYAIEIKTCQLKWKFDRSKRIRSLPNIDGNFIYFGCDDGYLYSLNITNGEIQWKFKTGAVIHTSPAIGDGQIYFGSSDGNCYALDAHSGQQKWKFSTRGEIRNSVLLLSGRLYFGSWDSSLYALDAKTGEQKWKFTTGGPICFSSLKMDKQILYVGSHDTYVYACDLNGQLKWKFKTGHEIHSSPAFCDGIIFVGCDDGYLYAIRKR